MPSVTTSPLRTLPQAPVVDPRLFTRVPSVQEGMQSFEAGAKLPLILENIKHEKKRIKLENSKLDFALSEAGRMQEAEARRQAILANQAEIGLKEAQTLKAAADAQLALADAAPVSVGTLSSPAVAAPSAASVAPLADAAPATEAVAPEPTPMPGIGPVTKSILQAIPPPPQGVPAPQYYQDVASQVVTKKLQAVFGPEVSAKVYKEKVLPEKMKLAETHSPKKGVYTFVGDNNVPMQVDAIMVGEQPVAISSAPRIDTKTLYERFPQQKKIDDKVAEGIGDVLVGDADRKIASNLANLAFAKQVLSSGDTVSGPVLSILPDAIRRRIPGLSEGVAAQDAIRSVVQQTLRETLGAQFARVEGEMMLQRAYDPTQEEAENIRRLELLESELADYARAKEDAANYLNANGTMYGYTGRKDFDTLAKEISDRFIANTAPAGAVPKTGGRPTAERDAEVQSSIDKYLSQFSTGNP